MICKRCGHFADDHTFDTSQDGRWCIREGCKCTGWMRDEQSGYEYTWEEEPEPLNERGKWVKVWIGNKMEYKWWEESIGSSNY